MPVLSLAWGNESAARRNEHKLRILAIQKAEEAQELQIVAVRNSEIARTERAAAVGSERKANEEKDRAQKALEFLVAAFRKPDPPATAASSKSSIFSTELCERSTNHFAINLSWKRPS